MTRAIHNTAGVKGATSFRKARSMGLSRSRVLAALLAPVLLASGCASHDKDHFIVGSTSHDYKERHPIIIGEQEKTLDIPVARASYDLPVASASAIEGFAGQFSKSANGHITVLVPSGSPNQRAARDVSGKVGAVLRRSGVPRDRIRYYSYDGSSHGDSAPIRLSYYAVTANVNGCGQWPADLGADIHRNRNYHNFGCASQSNLASMVSNPADLLGPRGMTSIDATRRNNVIENYRNGEQQIAEEPDRVLNPAE